MSVLDRIGSLRAEAEEAVAGAASSAALEELRVRYLGRKAELPNLLRGVAQLPPEERGTVGRAANQARQALEALIEQRASELEATELDTRLAQDRIDVTLPGEPPQPVGRLHLVTQTWREIEDVFLGLGFTSVEGLEVDEDITLADLKGTLLSFANAIFGEGRDVRLRPHFFPFTEPSVEVDVSCFNCDGTGFLKDGSRCRLCKGEGWIEILGAGEVDPNVYSYVDDDRYDPDKVQGFAWGMGIERIAQLRHGLTDMRALYDNDLRFLEQFG